MHKDYCEIDIISHYLFEWVLLNARLFYYYYFSVIIIWFLIIILQHIRVFDSSSRLENACTDVKLWRKLKWLLLHTLHTSILLPCDDFNDYYYWGEIKEIVFFRSTSFGLTLYEWVQGDNVLQLIRTNTHSTLSPFRLI